MAAGDTQITIAGNLVDDPGLRFTRRVRRWPGSGWHPPPVPGPLDGEWKDGDTLFLTCNVWRQAAENVAESLTPGVRVIVSGQLRQRSYETKEGEKRTVYEVEVDDVGPSLRNASAKVNKVARSGSGDGGYGSGPAGFRRFRRFRRFRGPALRRPGQLRRRLRRRRCRARGRLTRQAAATPTNPRSSAEF